MVRSSLYPSGRPRGTKNLYFAVVKKFSWTDKPRPIRKCKMVPETFVAKSEVRIFQKMTICV